MTSKIDNFKKLVREYESHLINLERALPARIGEHSCKVIQPYLIDFWCVLVFFKKNKRNIISRQAITILRVRDEIDKKVLEINKEEPTKIAENDAPLLQSNGINRMDVNSEEFYILLAELGKQDKKTKKLAGLISQIHNFSELKKIRKPSDDQWWWNLSHPLNRFDPIIILLSLLALTISISLGVDLANKFLKGGINAISIFSVIGPSLISLLFGKEIIDKVPQGKAWLERSMAGLGIPEEWRQEVIFILCLLLSLIMFGVHNLRGYFAKNNYCSAISIIQKNRKMSIASYKKYATENDCRIMKDVDNPTLNQAISRNDTPEGKLQVSIALNPVYADAYFLLGRIYELRLDTDSARSQYKLAIENNHLMASVRLAVITLLEAKEDSAKNATAILLSNPPDSILLSEARRLAKENSGSKEEKLQRLKFSEDVQSWYVALAWARYNKNDYEDSSKNLNEAETLKNEFQKLEDDSESLPITRYCIRAAIIEKDGSHQQAQDSWKQCKGGNSRDIEEDFWMQLARKCLKSKSSICLQEEKDESKKGEGKKGANG
jgi:tetratricopeptide (TPR) repeat protein